MDGLQVPMLMTYIVNSIQFDCHQKKSVLKLFKDGGGATWFVEKKCAKEKHKPFKNLNAQCALYIDNVSR